MDEVARTELGTEVGLPFLLGRQVRHFGSILFHDEEEVLLLLVAGGRNVHSRK